MSASSAAQPTLLFDGDVLFVREVRFLERRVRQRIRFVDIDGPD